MSTTTKFWTLAEIVAKVERDLDLEAETMISEAELTGYINDAIDDAEKEIHTLYEDYFLAKETLTLVSGQDSYDLPTTVYAHKIRRILYSNGAKVYEINRVRDWKKFLVYQLDRVHDTSDEYRYFLVNQTPGSPQILLTTTAKESGAYVTVWHLRQANRLVESSDVCDIPECVQYVIQYAKVKCYEKEGHPNYQVAVLELERELSKMQGVLAGMVPDDDNEIEADFSFYEDMN